MPLKEARLYFFFPFSEKLPGQQQRLIEASLPQSGSMQRHRHDKVGQEKRRIGQALPEQSAEGADAGQVPVVFEGMDYVAQRAPVGKEGTGLVKDILSLQAWTAEMID